MTSMSDKPPCNNEATEPPAMPQLPDGIGITFDQVIAELAAQNKTIVSKDDPILMMVTVLNAFLTEESKLLNKHNTALTGILSDRTKEYVLAVQETTASLGDCLSTASQDGIRKIFAVHGEKMERFRSNMIWLAAIVGASALVNVVTFAARALWRI
jgi:hypothetical protein